MVTDGQEVGKDRLAIFRAIKANTMKPIKAVTATSAIFHTRQDRF